MPNHPSSHETCHATEGYLLCIVSTYCGRISASASTLGRRRSLGGGIYVCRLHRCPCPSMAKVAMPMPWFYHTPTWIERCGTRHAASKAARASFNVTNTDFLQEGETKTNIRKPKTTPFPLPIVAIVFLAIPRPRAQDAKLTRLTSPCLTLFTQVVHQVVGVTEGVLDHEIEPQRVHQLVLGLQQTVFVPLVLLTIEEDRQMETERREGEVKLDRKKR